MKSDCIIQARLGSTRMPRKVLSLIDGKPLIQYVIDHLKTSARVNRVIVATTNNKIDDELCSYFDKTGVLYYRGSEENVLERFIETAEHYQCENVVRVCSDNPFIDIGKLDAQIEHYFLKQVDYCTYATKEGVAIILKPIGLFAEIVSYRALRKCFDLATEKKYFEHVTFFIYENSHLFKLEKIILDDSVNPDYRFTIDYPEDFLFCAEVIKKIPGQINLQSIMALMAHDVELRTMNYEFSMAHEKVY